MIRLGHRVRCWARRVMLIVVTLLAFQTAGCAYVALGIALLPKGSSSRPKRPQQPPVAFVDTIARAAGDIPIGFDLIDINGDDVTIEIEYSTDGGSTYVGNATDAGGASSGTGPLAASSGGTMHTFLWDSLTDLGPGAFTQTRIRIRPTDATNRQGQRVESDPFTAGDDAPVIVNLNPSGIQQTSGLIGIEFSLEDSTQDLCEIEVEYSTDGGLNYCPGGSPNCATISVGATAGLPSGAPGSPISYTIAWNSTADIGVQNIMDCRLRITPQDDLDGDGTPEAIGTPVETVNFPVTNNDNPSLFYLPIVRQKGPVDIEFLIVDSQGDLVDVVFEVEIDGGGFMPATIIGTDQGTITSTVGPADTVQGYSTTIDGVSHRVTWDNTADVGSTSAANITFRATPSDIGGMGTTRDSTLFVAGNDAPIIIPRNMSGDPPHQEGVIPIDFMLGDSSQDPTDILVEYSTDGRASWSTATIVVGIFNGVPSELPPPTTNIRFAWGAATDLPNTTDDVELRLTPSDTATGAPEIGTPGFTGLFTVDNLNLPIAYLASPIGAQTVGGEVTISYLLLDTLSSNLSVRLEYSTDGSPPSLIPTRGTGGEGLVNLTSSPSGVPHTFVWDTNTDLPGQDHTMVKFKVTPVDSMAMDGISSPASPPVFLVNNNREPISLAGTPTGPQTGGQVVLSHRVRDFESNPVDITVTYSLDGTNFFPATEGVGGDGTTGLSSSPGGTVHTFIWDTSAATGDDIAFSAPETTVVVQVAPSDNAIPSLGDGTPGQTDFFVVDNTTPATATIVNVPDPAVGDVVIDYVLNDDADELAPQDITVEFSTDGFTSDIRTATECSACAPAAPASDGTTGLPSDGTPLVFRWRSTADLGPAFVGGVQLRITPMDSKVGTPDVSALFDVDNNAAPVIALDTPSGIQSDIVLISYTLSDTNADPANLTLVQYSTDNGGSWANATEGPNPPSQGTGPLFTDTIPVSHFFLWDSIADIAYTGPHTSTRFRMQVSDTSTGNTSMTGPFTLDNGVLKARAILAPITRDLADDVRIDYQLFDGDSDVCSVLVEWSTDGGMNWSTATEQPGAPSEGIVGLASSPQGVPHTFVWDSANAADLNSSGIAVQNILVRITPTDADDGVGTAGSTGPFIRGNDIPSVVINDPPDFDVKSGLIRFDFDLTDSTSDPIDVVSEWSTDGGTSWSSASIVVGGTQGLASSPGGTNHSYAWNSLDLLPAGNYSNVQFRIWPEDFVALNGTPDIVTIDVENNDLPISFIGSPTLDDLRSGSVLVEHILIDSNSDPIDITVEFWNGVAWQPAVEDPVPPSDGTTNLASTPDGVEYQFLWNSSHALAFPATDTATARVRITPDDPANTGLAFPTDFFLVNNNQEPAVKSIDSFPPGDQSGNISIVYTLTDAESDPTDLTVEFSTDGGGTFAPATSGGGDGTTNLATSPSGTAHTFVWASNNAADLQGLRETSVVVRIVPRDNPNLTLGLGTLGQTAVFIVDNTVAPVVNNLANVGSSGLITMNYDLFDAEPAAFVNTTVEFSTDSGTTWWPASIQSPTPDGGTLGNIIENQAPSNVGSGAAKTVDWDSNMDIGRTDLAGVRIRFTPEDTKIGNPTTDTIDVTNNDAPIVSIVDISGVQSGDVIITYTLEDSFSDTLDITVEYSLDGGLFSACTEVPGPPSQGTTGLSSGPAGQEVGHIFVWDTGTDLSSTFFDVVEIRIEAAETTSPFATGVDISNVFTVDNRIQADLVVGQNDFLQGGVDARGVNNVNDITFDGTRLYVADTSNHRVLIFNAVPGTDFQTADLVLGQTNFFVNLQDFQGPSATSMDSPEGVWSDGTGVYVADTANHRVLVWDTFPTSNGEMPDFVLGQVDFTSELANQGGGPANDTLDSPNGVYGTTGGSPKLFVADRGNNRVLRYDLPITANAEPATLVLGQADFTSNTADRGTGVNSDTLDVPRGLYTDGTSLYVADQNNHRVLIWDTLPVANGEAADRVLGQPNFISQTANNGGRNLNSMNRPYDVSADPGNTFVADRSNNRVLVWTSSLPVSSSNANFVLGQPDGITGTANNGGLDASSIRLPQSVASSGTDDELLISDQVGNRVKIHNPRPVGFDEDALLALGQEDLFSALANHGIVDAKRFNFASGTDVKNGALYVADQQNSRVLVWETLPTVNFKNADIVLGQPNFSSFIPALNANGQNQPSDVAYDTTNDRLFVSDRGYNRVIVYNAPLSVGQAGDQFIGQSVPNGATPGSTAQKLNGPAGVSWDGTHLWVADEMNHRIVRFPSAQCITNGVADIVVGQTGFGLSSPNHGDNDGTRGMNSPLGVVVTGTAGTDKLIVADRTNHRVVLWDRPNASDPVALRVLGETTFVVPGTAGVSRSDLRTPAGVESDGTMILVNDAGNHRTMIWDSIPTANGQQADRLIGQEDFVTDTPNSSGVTNSSLFLYQDRCGSAALDGTILWLPDTRNNRVLRFDVAP